MTGRGIRHALLVGPEGRWRDQLWLDDLVLTPPDEESAEEDSRPVLTAPLPINSCSVDSLTLLPGVGPVLAGRIDEARRRGVVFSSPEGLREVKGIGPSLSARLETLIVFHGLEVPSGDHAEEIPAFPALSDDPFPASEPISKSSAGISR